MGAAREHAKDPPGEPAGPKSLLLVASKEKAAHEKGVKRVCIPNRSTKSADRKREQKKRWFRNGQKWRTGCEGRISVVKRRHGLNRSRWSKPRTSLADNIGLAPDGIRR